MFNIFSKLLPSSQPRPHSPESNIDARAALFPLTQIIRTSCFSHTASARSAISQLLRLIQEPGNAVLVCQDPEMDLLPIIKKFYQVTLNSLVEIDERILDHITVVLSWLALPQSNTIRICSKEFGFLPVLFEMINTPDIASPYVSHLVWQDVRNEILVILGNCSVHVETHDYLFLPEFAYFVLCKEQLLASPDSPGEVSRFCSLTMNIADSAHMLLLVDMGIPEFFLKKLVNSGSEGGPQNTDYWNMIDRCFCILLNFSLHPPCCPALRILVESPNISALALFKDLLLESPDNSIKGLKTITLLTNIYCEASTDPPLNVSRFLTYYSYVPFLLFDIYAATLEYDDTAMTVKNLKRKGFMFGRLSMKQITGSLKNFVIISDKNKELLFCRGGRLFSLVYQTIQLFLIDAEECQGTIISTTGVTRSSTAGGGGKDYESLENVLEFLLQVIVYYSYKSCDELRQIFSTVEAYSSSTLNSLLEQLLALPEHRNVSNKTKQCAILLLNRLESL
jgi:hypothetical protein